jgi:prevent-host-death family protein
MTALPPTSPVVSVTEATTMGIAALVREAQSNGAMVVSRRGRPVAAVVSMERLHELDDLEGDLRDIALVLARTFSDTGERTSLDDAIAASGFDRATLEAELDADLAAGRE